MNDTEAMKVLPRLTAFLMAICITGHAQAGFLVVNSDEWTLSDTGFANSPTTDVFINNVTNLFSGDSPGNFLAYSTNFGLTGSALASAVTGAGHSWTVSTAVTFDVPSLMAYDGVFLGALPTVDQTVLIDYLNAGGNAYIMAGTGTVGGPGPEAAAWNDVLALGGLAFDSTWCCSTVVAPPTDATHPLLDGVDDLFFNFGNPVMDLDTPGTNGEILFTYSGYGMLGLASFGELPPPSVYSPVPTPPMAILLGLGLLMIGGRRRIIRND